MYAEIGEIIYFIAAQKIECSECKQYTPDLSFSVEEGRVLVINENSGSRWSQVKTCQCKDNCLCLTENDYTQQPTITSVRSYAVLSKEHGLLSFIPGSAIFTERAVADKYAGKPAPGTTVFIRPKTAGVLPVIL